MQSLNENKIKEKKSGRRKNIFTDYLDAVHTRKNLFLLWAFLLPMGILLLLYVSLKVYPFGDGSVLVLDLNGQYVYFFEELRSKILSGGSLLYSWSRSLGGRISRHICVLSCKSFFYIGLSVSESSYYGSIIADPSFKSGVVRIYNVALP